MKDWFQFTKKDWFQVSLKNVINFVNVKKINDDYLS